MINKTEQIKIRATKAFKKKLARNAKAKKMYRTTYIEWLVGLHEAVVEAMKDELPGAWIADYLDN